MMFRSLLLLVCVLVMACDVPQESSVDSRVLVEGRSGKADDGALEITDEDMSAQEEIESLDIEENDLEADEPSEENTETEETEAEEDPHPLMWGDEDICETAGFYDDEDCHDFCPKEDPVCPPPEPVIEPEPIDCTPELPTCEEGQAMVDTDQNECMDTCVEAGVGCAVNSDCGDGEYCARAMGECDASLGTCTVTETPECEFDSDTFELDLVCGCDGYAHATPCDAAYVGVNVDYKGLCEEDQ